MGLEHALDVLMRDRQAVSGLREILALLACHPHDWFALADIQDRVTDPTSAERVVGVLADSLVVDAQHGPARYRLAADPLVGIEVERFLRRTVQDEQRTQTNLARYRKRYHLP